MKLAVGLLFGLVLAAAVVVVALTEAHSHHYSHSHSHDDDHGHGHLRSSSSSGSSSDNGWHPGTPTRRPFTHNCIHDAPWHQAIIRRHLRDAEPTPHRSVLSRDADPLALGGLRVKYSDMDLNLTTKYCTAVGETRPDFTGGSTTCRSQDILTDDKRSILTQKVLPAAIGLIKKMVNFTNLAAPIVVPSNACNGLSYTIPTSHTTTGVADADYVLYVSAGRTPENVIAFAGGCGFDGSGRINHGRANFGPEYLVWDDANPRANDDLVKTAVHELWHALGFSYSIFQGKSLTSTADTARGKSLTTHTGAQAIAAAQLHFNCPTLSGVELEDEGGTGSKLSHPDKRLFADDFMAASGGHLLGAVTIAMLADLGYYTPAAVSTGVQQNSTFGSGGGCGFLTQYCNVAAGGRDREFCFDASQLDVCNYDFTGAGYCGINTWSGALPAYFQYFAGEPTKGGHTFYDGCPVINVYSNRWCHGERAATFGDYVLGFTFTRNSRCFRTAGVARNGYGTSGVGVTRCLVSRCVPDGGGGRFVQFQINGSGWIDCPSEGATVGSLPGYQGTVTCPQSYATFCDYYDAVPAPADGYPADFEGSAGGGSAFGQVPTRAGAIKWISGALTFYGGGWVTITGAPHDEIVQALQRDIAGLLGVNARDVFITAAYTKPNAAHTHRILHVDYMVTNTDVTVEHVRQKFTVAQQQNATAWLSRTRNAYQQHTGAVDSPVLASHTANYELSWLERLFLGLGIGPFSGIVVAAFLLVCIIVAIFFCFCKDACCPSGDDINTVEPSGDKKNTEQPADKPQPVRRGGMRGARGGDM